jgi:ankyrin repeat protein
MKKSNQFFVSNQVRILTLISLLALIACNGRERTTSINKTQKQPVTDIHTASFMGNIGAIRQHIDYGTDLNAKDAYGSTPLIIAAIFGRTEVAKILIEAGANLNIKGSDGSTALHSAAFFCRTEIVKSLLDGGADKTLTNIYGSTPYQSVAGPFEEVKPAYDQMSKDLGPLGLKLDYKSLEETRPEIAKLLK